MDIYEVCVPIGLYHKAKEGDSKAIDMLKEKLHEERLSMHIFPCRKQDREMTVNIDELHEIGVINAVVIDCGIKK